MRLTKCKRDSPLGDRDDRRAPVPVQARRISGAVVGPHAGAPSDVEVASLSCDWSKPTATREACSRTGPPWYQPTTRLGPADTPIAPCRPERSSGADRTDPLPVRGHDPGRSSARLPDATQSATSEGGESAGRDRADLPGVHSAYRVSFLRSCRRTSRLLTGDDGSMARNKPPKKSGKPREGFSVYARNRRQERGHACRSWSTADHCVQERGTPTHGRRPLTGRIRPRDGSLSDLQRPGEFADVE